MGKGSEVTSWSWFYGPYLCTAPVFFLKQLLAPQEGFHAQQALALLLTVGPSVGFHPHLVTRNRDTARSVYGNGESLKKKMDDIGLSPIFSRTPPMFVFFWSKAGHFFHKRSWEFPSITLLGNRDGFRMAPWQCRKMGPSVNRQPFWDTSPPWITVVVCMKLVEIGSVDSSFNH